MARLYFLLRAGLKDSSPNFSGMLIVVSLLCPGPEVWPVSPVVVSGSAVGWGEEPSYGPCTLLILYTYIHVHMYNWRYKIIIIVRAYLSIV